MSYLTDLILANPSASDADVLAAANADLRTTRPIPLNELEPMLLSSGLRRGIEAIAADAGVPEQLRDGASDLIATLDSPRIQNLDTTDPVIAGRVAGFVQWAIQLQRMTSDHATAILALGGGYRLGPGVTAADVTAARAELARADLQRRASNGYQRASEAVGAGTTDHAAIVAAFAGGMEE